MLSDSEARICMARSIARWSRELHNYTPLMVWLLDTALPHARASEARVLPVAVASAPAW
jgi:hypothetical protein